MRYLMILCCALPLLAQEEVRIDLAANHIVKAPTRIDPPATLVVRVENVNDFLYSYRGSIKVDPIPDTSDGAGSQKLNSLEVSNCPSIAAAAERLKKGLDANFRLQPQADGNYRSIPLQESAAAWNRLRPDYDTLERATEAERGCPAWTAYAEDDRVFAAGLAQAAAGKHEYVFPVTLAANGTVTVTIQEFYGTKPTTGGERTYTFVTSSNQFFLSVGYLATQVQARSYDVVDVGSTGSGTSSQALKELRIQGTGRFRPAGMVLMNYKLPWKYLSSPRAGFALSGGAVYRPGPGGDSATATNLGIFAGISFHLWERFWITPGWHIGEFSDLPRGFSAANGLKVPDGYPSSFTGVNRWTTRFAIGITFRAADFKAATKLLGESLPAGTGKSGDPSAAGAAATAAKPADAEKAAESASATTVQIRQLRAAISQAEQTLNDVAPLQAAAAELLRSANEALQKAEDERKAKQQATTTCLAGKARADAAVRDALAHLAKAQPGAVAGVRSELKNAQEAAVIAAEALGRASAEEQAAAATLRDAQARQASASQTAMDLTAKRDAAQKALDALMAKWKAVCGTQGNCGN